MASITLKNIVKTYDNKVTVIPGLDLEIHDKEFIILVGPSGCGKSTTLRMIAGLEEITAGELYIGEKKVNNVAPKDRDIAMVFQNYALYPHMTVYKNMAFGLMLRKTPRAEIDRKVHEAAQTLGIEEYLNRKPRALSGGQRQALTLLMATLRKPDLLLLDEPINGLDPQGIAEIRDMIFKLRDEQNMTIIISSHILEELSKIATHYGIIHNGTLVQEITKEELMQRCGERMEIFLDDPKQALPVLDQMGFKNYQVTDKNTIHIYERLDESAAVNMELAKAGVSVRGIGITSEELENYFLNLTGGASHA